MAQTADKVFRRLISIFRAKKPFQKVFIYLDKEQIIHSYGELTGLQGFPKAKVESIGGKFQANLVLVSPTTEARIDTHYEIPLHMVFGSIEPVLKKKIPKGEDSNTINKSSSSFFWIEGTLRRTRFPEGEDSLEIFFNNIHGLLFLSEEYIASIYRPYLRSRNMSDLQVESLVYVHSKTRTHKFSYPGFGDGKVHSWVPISPVSILISGGS